MILIISEESDESTNDVLEWIRHLGHKFVRLNKESECTFDFLVMDNRNVNFTISNNKNKINLNEIKSYWFRRGTINLRNTNINIPIKRELYEQLYQERFFLLDFIFFTAENKRNLGNYYTSTVSKLKSLYFADLSGLKIPKTYIATNKNDLEKIIENKEPIITKSIQDNPNIKIQDNSYFVYTENITKKNLNKYKNKFFPSLIQKNIKKKYELRIFYIDGKCYTMAIFSQADKQTKTDFRKYNFKNPNRNVPYKLPKEMVLKIKKFMNFMNLNTGSIDMIVTPNDEYVFLEVNPVGQFGMVSQPCNYYLEKKIAEYLIN